LNERRRLGTTIDSDGRWIVASIEQDAEGRHVLDEDVVASPWSDDRRLQDASMMDVAANDKLPEGVSTAEVASLDYAGNGRAAALDLSRSSTGAGAPTSWRPPSTARSPPGPRRSTAPTAACSRSRRQPLPATCFTPATRRSRRGS
jgi:hypothetical protein